MIDRILLIAYLLIVLCFDLKVQFSLIKYNLFLDENILGSMKSIFWANWIDLICLTTSHSDLGKHVNRGTIHFCLKLDQFVIISQRNRLIWVGWLVA